MSMTRDRFATPLSAALHPPDSPTTLVHSMATAREKKAFRTKRRRIEREAAQDAAAARHRVQTAQRALAAHDRALKRSGRGRNPRPIIRVASKAVRHPVRPPPFYSRAGISYCRRLQTIDGIRATSFHCAVSQTSQGSKAVAHQVYIERKSAVVASFGTLGETLEERKEVWTELDARAPLKRGCITLPEGAPPDLREALRPVLQRLADDGAIPRRPTAAWLRQPNRRLAIRGLDHDRYETLAHAIGDAYRDAIDRNWAAATRVGKPPTLPPKILGHPPRSPMLQRRIVLELPHEVTDHAREQILRDFCARTFVRRGIPYHAVIHAPAAGNDDRNFHGHIVSTHHQICRDQATGRWDFLASEEMPAVHDFGRDITSNARTPEGKPRPAAERRTIQRELFQELRQTFATAANGQLRMQAVPKRYDPRSYHDRGLAITPGSHLGPAAAAAAKRGGTVGRSPHRAAWLNAAAALAEAAPDKDPEEIRRLIDTEMVAQSLPPDCLPPDCHGEIQADRHRLACLRATVEYSFLALAGPAHPARSNAPALPQRPTPPAVESPRPPASDPDPQATPQRSPTASGTELAIPDILPPPFRTARPQATARPHRAGLLAPALPQRPAPPAADTPRPAPVPDPQATPQRPPTASATELAIPGIHPSPTLRTTRPQATARPHHASLLAPALPQRPVPPAAETPRPAPVQDPQATPQRPPTASGTELAIPGIHPSPPLRTTRPQATARPRRASLLAPALPQRPVPPAAETPRPAPVQDPQATPQRPPTASGTEIAIPDILPPPFRTARPQATARPRPRQPSRASPPAAPSSAGSRDPTASAGPGSTGHATASTNRIRHRDRDPRHPPAAVPHRAPPDHCPTTTRRPSRASPPAAPSSAGSRRPHSQRRSRIHRPRHSVHQPHPAPRSRSPTSSRRRSAPRAPRPLPDHDAPAFSRQPSRSAQLRRQPRPHSQRRSRIHRPRHSVHQPHPAPRSRSPTSSRRRSAPRAPRPLPDHDAPAFSRQPSRSAQLRRQPRPHSQRRSRIHRPRHSVHQPHPPPSPTPSRAPRTPSTTFSTPTFPSWAPSI